MSNGQIGNDMAEREIYDLLKEARNRQQEQPKEGHCPDHEHQQRVNYYTLCGIYAILNNQRCQKYLTPVVAGITMGIILALSKILTGS